MSKVTFARVTLLDANKKEKKKKNRGKKREERRFQEWIECRI